MTEYRQGDEFKTGVVSEAAKRIQTEAKRQGRSVFGHDRLSELDTADNRFQDMAQLVEIQARQTALSEAERAAAEALALAQKREQAARDNLEKIRKAATTTEDGRQVYLTQDGLRAFDDQGNELTAEEIAAIHWQADAPTWEQRQAAGDRLEAAIAERQEIEDYQERLAGDQETLEHGDSLTSDELDSIDRTLADMPDSVRTHLGGLRRPATSAALEYDGQGIQADPLSPAFARAMDGIPQEIRTFEPIAPTKGLDL